MNVALIIFHLIPRSGRGEGLVVSIGEQTEFGAIFATMQEVGFCYFNESVVQRLIPTCFSIID